MNRRLCSEFEFEQTQVEVGYVTLGEYHILSLPPSLPWLKQMCEGYRLPHPSCSWKSPGDPHLLLSGEDPALGQLHVSQDAILPIKQEVKDFHAVQGCHSTDRGRHLD